MVSSLANAPDDMDAKLSVVLWQMHGISERSASIHLLSLNTESKSLLNSLPRLLPQKRETLSKAHENVMVQLHSTICLLSSELVEWKNKRRGLARQATSYCVQYLRSPDGPRQKKKKRGCGQRFDHLIGFVCAQA